MSGVLVDSGGPVGGVLGVLVAKMAELLEVPLATVDPGEPLIDIGADSLILMEAVSFLEHTYGIRLGARQILEELPTLELLAVHIDLVATRGPRQEEVVTPPPPVTVPGSAREDDGVDASFVSWMPREAAAAPAGASMSDPTPDLVAAFAHRLAGSKAHADRYRRTHSDPRSVASFRRPIKEVVFPVVASRARGSRMWDIDGNEYVDLAMGFGSLLFGHGHPPIQRAVEQQLRAISGVGPVSFLAGPLSEEICALTGHDRATFVTTGTEAVMLAARLARATTGRPRVATFRDSYHGWWDGSLALPGPTVGSAMSAVGGVIGAPPQDLLVLPWGDDSALEVIEEHAASLAAVLVEPVQSRRPDRQHAERLAELRTLTARHGIVLIFDEMITGFRLAAGGASEVFGVQPDLSTFGKALGGGLPIGCVAGRRDLLDALDGGRWRFGDESEPLLPATFGAGTFGKHPLSMAAAWAVVQEIRRLGPTLYEQLDRRSGRLQDELDALLRHRGIEAELVRCGSMMRFLSRRNLDAFFAGLIRNGCYLWEGRTLFLSWAHDDRDVDRVVEGCERALDDLREPVVSRRRDDSVGPEPARVALPMTPNQRRIVHAYRSGSEGAGGFHNAAVVRFEGSLDVDALRRAIAALARRHESFRTTFDLEREVEILGPHAVVALEVVRPEGASGSVEPRRRAVEVLDRCCTDAFDLAQGPLWRFCLVDEGPAGSRMAMACSDLVADGVGLGVVISELVQLYEGFREGPLPTLPEAATLASVRDWLASDEHRAREAEAVEHWREKLRGVDPTCPLPHAAGLEDAGFAMARAQRVLDTSIVTAVESFGRARGITTASVLLAAFAVLVHRIGGRDDFLVGVPTATRPSGLRHAVASLSTPVAIRVRVTEATTIDELLRHVQGQLLDALERPVPIDVLERLQIAPDGAPCHLLVPVMFNIDPLPEVPVLGDGVQLKIDMPTKTFGTSPFFAELCPTNDRSLIVSFDSAPSVFPSGAVEEWVDGYLELLGALPASGSATVGSLPGGS